MPNSSQVNNSKHAATTTRSPVVIRVTINKTTQQQPNSLTKLEQENKQLKSDIKSANKIIQQRKKQLERINITTNLIQNELIIQTKQMLTNLKNDPNTTTLTPLYSQIETQLNIYEDKEQTDETKNKAFLIMLELLCFLNKTTTVAI